jgi:hypothetical protein
MINYGVESTNSLQAVKDKRVAYYQTHHGVDHQLQIPSVAASVSQKNTDNAEERLALAAITKKERYNDENYNNRLKYVETCNERFGVDNPSQNAEIHDKQFRKRYVDYLFPSGRTESVQGYEPYALNDLLDIFHENEIIVSRSCMPDIWYIENGNKRYFPDIFISSANLIVEVKSQWTYSGKDEWLTTNLLKKQACIDAGYSYMLMIYDDHGKIILNEMS